MRRSTIENAERKLRERRARLLKLHDSLAAGELELRGGRLPDWEDFAADKTTADRLASLEERELAELRAVHGALVRIRDGQYGSCHACRREIPAARLEAVPETRFCVDCAAAREVFSG